MTAVMHIYGALLQVPGLEAPDLTFGEQVEQIWADTGFMKWPLSVCLILGLLVIAWKFVDLQGKAGKTRKVLRDVDELLNEKRIREALELTRDSNAPAAKIL